MAVQFGTAEGRLRQRFDMGHWEFGHVAEICVLFYPALRVCYLPVSASMCVKSIISLGMYVPNQIN